MNSHARNPVNIRKAIGSTWTSTTERNGWRHFRVVAIQPQSRGRSLVELMAACDKAVRFWIPVSELKDRAAWTPGWSEGLVPGAAPKAS